jgi:hypothetical protein
LKYKLIFQPIYSGAVVNLFLSDISCNFRQPIPGKDARSKVVVAQPNSK